MTTDDIKVTWVKAAPISAFSEDGGAAIKYEMDQIAIFNFTSCCASVIVAIKSVKINSIFFI